MFQTTNHIGMTQIVWRGPVLKFKAVRSSTEILMNLEYRIQLLCSATKHFQTTPLIHRYFVLVSTYQNNLIDPLCNLLFPSHF